MKLTLLFTLRKIKSDNIFSDQILDDTNFSNSSSSLMSSTESENLIAVVIVIFTCAFL